MLLSTNIGHSNIEIQWEMKVGYIVLNGLEYHFEVECGLRSVINGVRKYAYKTMYLGTATHFNNCNLMASTTYGVRCRAVNPLFKSPWSFPLRVKTMPGNSIIIIFKLFLFMKTFYSNGFFLAG